MESSYDRMMAEKSFLPYRMGYLTDWMVKKAETELNETDAFREQALDELRKLIKNENNLDIWTDDTYLLQFLRVRKFDPESAMEVIRNLYTLFKDYPDIYPKNSDTGIADGLFETNAGGAYPYRHKDGSVIIFIKVSNWDPEQVPIQVSILAMAALALSIAEDPATQVCGVHLLYDAGFNINHLRVVTPRMFMAVATFLRNTLPIRLIAIHVVNDSAVFRYLFNVLKIFLTKKMRNRFHFHGNDYKQLHQYIPKEILPAQYGGDNDNYSASEFCKEEIGPFVQRFSEMLCKGYC